MEAPATWPQYPDTLLCSSQALDCDGPPGRLLDFNQWQVERRLDCTLRIAAAPDQKDVSNLKSRSLSLRIFLDGIRYDAFSKFEASWLDTEILRTGGTSAKKGKQKQE